jgi:hypothetical protein
LQGFTDEQFNRAAAAGISDNQLYKMAGNAVSVPVITAISRVIKEVEEINKKYDQNNYMVGVAHLYTACVMTAEFEEDNIYNQNYNEFYDLWNLAAANPSEFRKHLDKLIPVLKDMKKDRNFNDVDAMIALQESNSIMRVNVTK